MCTGSEEVVRKHKARQVRYPCETDVEITWITATIMPRDHCIFWVRLLISKGTRNLSYQACILKVYCHTQLGARFNKVKLLTLRFQRAAFLLSASWWFSFLWNTCLKAKHFQWLDDAMGLTPVQEDEWAPLVSPDITQVHTAGFSHMPWYYLLVSVRINTLYRHFFTVVWGFFVLTKYCIQIYFFSQNETINLFSLER